MTPKMHALFLALAILPCAARAASEPQSGPRVAFERHGATVCATYAIDGAFDLYHDRIFARQGGARLALAGLPAGSPKSIAGVAESVMRSGFKACATAPSAAGEVQWIDQSCMSAQGVCLPPRAHSIPAAGPATPIDGARSASLFMESMAPASASRPSSDGWSFGFKPR